MATYTLVVGATFLSGGTGREGMSAYLTLYDIVGSSIVLNSQLMSELGAGAYHYDWGVADDSKYYYAVADCDPGGAAGVPDQERYSRGYVSGVENQIVVDTNEIDTIDGKIDTIDGKIDTIDTEIGVIDGNVTSIKNVTDVLPNSGTLTDIDTGINNIEAKLPSKNYLTGTNNSDGDIEVNESTGDFNTTQKASINSECDTAISDASLATSTSVAALAANLAIVKQIEAGTWKIINDQLIFYDSDGTTPLYTFNLFDADGNATSTNPTQRVLVE